MSSAPDAMPMPPAKLLMDAIFRQAKPEETFVVFIGEDLAEQAQEMRNNGWKAVCAAPQNDILDEVIEITSNATWKQEAGGRKNTLIVLNADRVLSNDEDGLRTVSDELVRHFGPGTRVANCYYSRDLDFTFLQADLESMRHSYFGEAAKFCGETEMISDPSGPTVREWVLDFGELQAQPQPKPRQLVHYGWRAMPYVPRGR